MNSRQRILATLEHLEPDRVPLDLGGTHVTGIHIQACKNLCDFLGIKDAELLFTDELQQIVRLPPKILELFEVDTYGLFPLCSHNWNIISKRNENYDEYKDEWGLGHRRPIENGFWWSQKSSPISSDDICVQDIDNYTWPKANLKSRLLGLKEQAIKARNENKIVIMKGLCAGIFEMGQRLRGMENFLCDLLLDKKLASKILDKILELKLEFWEMAISELGEYIDIIVETDDYGTQESQLISKSTYQELIEPRLRYLIYSVKQKLQEQKKNGEKGYFLFHSCGNVRPLIESFIGMGIDIINPVHITVEDMAPAELKKDFGNDITFWGGGVETQFVLPKGTVIDIKENVKRNLNAFMPGGGFVFATVHNIMAEVPPQNILAMIEALKKNGVY